MDFLRPSSIPFRRDSVERLHRLWSSVLESARPQVDIVPMGRLSGRGDSGTGIFWGPALGGCVDNSCPPIVDRLGLDPGYLAIFIYPILWPMTPTIAVVSAVYDSNNGGCECGR